MLDFLKGLFTSEPQEMIDVEITGSYKYKIVYSYQDDYTIVSWIEVRAKCNIGGFTYNRSTYCSASIANGETKVDVYKRFGKISEEKRREIMFKALKKKLVEDIKEYVEDTNEEDVEKMLQKMDEVPLNFTMKIEKSKIAKK